MQVLAAWCQRRVEEADRGLEPEPEEEQEAAAEPMPWDSLRPWWRCSLAFRDQGLERAFMHNQAEAMFWAELAFLLLVRLALTIKWVALLLAGRAGGLRDIPQATRRGDRCCCFEFSRKHAVSAPVGARLKSFKKKGIPPPPFPSGGYFSRSTPGTWPASCCSWVASPGTRGTARPCCWSTGWSRGAGR